MDGVSYISDRNAEAIIRDGLARIDLQGKRVLLIIPDTTRTAPVGLVVKTIYRILKGCGAKMDLLVALGTHKPLSRNAILRHLDTTEKEYSKDYGDTEFFNHQWDNPSSLTDIGVLPAKLIHELTDGLMEEDVKIDVNRMIFDYDHVLIVGPVFPHEVAGFSGGNKYFFPGISGPEIIDFFHWLGAVITNMKIIGRADNPVRHLLDEAVKLIPIPMSAISLVIHGGELAGLYVGSTKDSWQKAVELSSKLHIVRKPHPFKKVLSCAPTMYEDMWTGGKCMYKCEPVVAEGGEIIIYAPHIRSLSYTHGHILEKIGYHVRDYYLQNIEHFADIPRVVMAISTYLKGTGTHVNDTEKPRIEVILATGISPEMCRKVGLGYEDPEGIDPSQWRGREDEGILFVEKAGETLFLLENNTKE